MRIKSLPLILLLACRSAPTPGAGASADAIYEGRADAGTRTDTVEARSSVAVERARWLLKNRPDARSDFWTDIALLDLANADLAARSLDERTFSSALRTLMDGDPESAAVGFAVLHAGATDTLVRFRSRVGLTMALSWHSDWSAISRIATPARPAESTEDPLAIAAGVERWARALGEMGTPRFSVPDEAVTLPMRRSAFGTPVITVKINGRPYEFWLDTGASMTLLSAEVALESGVKLAARDTLALGVVAGHVEARAVFLDSLGIGPVLVRGLAAALVGQEVLRLDQRVDEGGATRPVRIAGMIGTDVLRHLDVVLDAGAGTITIRKPRPTRAAVRNLFWIGYPVVRLVTRDGRAVLFGLDTGAEGTYVTSTLLKKMPDVRLAARKFTLTGLGAEHKNRTQSDWVARDVPLSDGSYAIALRFVPVLPAQRWTFVNFDGVLGSDVALATRMHLDFTNGVFDIRNSAALAKPTPGALDGVKVF